MLLLCRHVEVSLTTDARQSLLRISLYKSISLSPTFQHFQEMLLQLP